MHVDIIGRTQDKTMDEILKSTCDGTFSPSATMSVEMSDVRVKT